MFKYLLHLLVDLLDIIHPLTDFKQWSKKGGDYQCFCIKRTRLFNLYLFSIPQTYFDDIINKNFLQFYRISYICVYVESSLIFIHCLRLKFSFFSSSFWPDFTVISLFVMVYVKKYIFFIFLKYLLFSKEKGNFFCCFIVIK